MGKPLCCDILFCLYPNFEKQLSDLGATHEEGKHKNGNNEPLWLLCQGYIFKLFECSELFPEIS